MLRGSTRLCGGIRRLSSHRVLTSLERAAVEDATNPAKQVALYQSLSRVDPSASVRRIEMGSFAQSPGVVQEYLKALLCTNSGFVYETASEIVSRAIPTVVSTAPTTEAFKLKNWGWDLASKLIVTGVTLGGVAAIVLLLMDYQGNAFGKSQPIKSANSTTTFSDVKGCHEAKQELVDLVSFLRDPRKFTSLGGTLPKGLLLTGPPGNGKTLLARAIAGEAKVPFFFTSGSEFEEIFVGVGAKRVRELFAAAKKEAPCIIFIDEVDAVGGTRKMKEIQSMRATLNQLLVEMDGFEGSEGVIVVAATNFPELLDQALVRPGRFDKQVHIALPDVKGRKEIIELYLKKIVAGPDVDPLVLARGTPGCSGADLSNIVNSAAVEAAIRGMKQVSMEVLEYAKDKVLMGSERKSAIIPEPVRRKTAFHEGGHALVAIFTEGTMPIHKATIIPRGQSLGMVMQLPEGDQVMSTRKELLASMDVCMGGRVAEELIFGDENVSTGASSDFQQANRIARGMVSAYGMSDALGKVVFSGNNPEPSPEAQRLIETEVKKLTDESYERAKALLRMRFDELHLLANALLEYETLTEKEIRAVVRGESLNRSL